MFGDDPSRSVEQTHTASEDVDEDIVEEDEEEGDSDDSEGVVVRGSMGSRASSAQAIGVCILLRNSCVE